MKRREFISQGSVAITALAMPLPLAAFTKYNSMTDSNKFDVIIIGGSYAGLSAAMSLGRSLRHVLIIDSGLPCNRQTPYSHNFLTQDGSKPQDISAKAKSQVEQYQTVKFYNGLAIDGKKKSTGFEISTHEKETFHAKKLIFATGLKDIMPDIKGFSECWGISVVHCPYCHGYENRGAKTGILANGDVAFHYARLISNLTKDLTIFTNGKSTLTAEQTERIAKHSIPIIEKEIAELNHQNGSIQEIVFKDQTTFALEAIFSRPDFEQHCKIPEKLGCELNEQKYIQIDMFQKTTVADVFACGDNSSPLRAVSNAVASGNITGAMINNELTIEEF